MNKEEYDKYKKVVDELDGYDICDEFNLGTYELKDKKKLLEIVLMYYFKNQDELQEKDKETERLNNIIDEMEKFFKNAFDNEVRPLGSYKVSVWTICLDKLKELKEGK
jgi:hypothetical protein